MNVHKNALFAPKGREAMVRRFTDHGWPKAKIARQFHTTVKTVAKWIRRFLSDGIAGLYDRSSRPRSMPSRTAPAIRDHLEALRRRRYTQAHIARELGRFCRPGHRVTGNRKGQSATKGVGWGICPRGG